jgi:hypothetical protein
MTVTTPFLEIKYQGTMLMNHGYIDAGIVDLEPEGVINLESRGYEATTTQIFR